MKTLIYFVMALFLVSFVNAAAVVVQNTPSAQGLDISYPLFSVGPPNTKFYPLFHINNVSNGYEFYDKINCSMEIYDPTGIAIFHAWNNTFSSDDRHIYIDIPTTLFNSTGTYSYYIYCGHNETALGGFLTSTIEITPDGTTHETDGLFYFTIVISIISMIVILLIVGEKMELWYMKEENAGINIGRYISYILSGWLCVPLVAIAVKLEYVTELGLTNTIGGVYYALMTIMLILTTLSVIGFVIMLIKRIGDYG